MVYSPQNVPKGTLYTQRVKPILLAFITEIKGISGSAMASNIPFWCGHKRKGPPENCAHLRKYFARSNHKWTSVLVALSPKPFDIPKREVWEAYKRVKANQGAAGVDGEFIESFEADGIATLTNKWGSACDNSSGREAHLLFPSSISARHHGNTIGGLDRGFENQRMARFWRTTGCCVPIALRVVRLAVTSSAMRG